MAQDLSRLREEWESFKTRLDDLMLRHTEAQEEIFAQLTRQAAAATPPPSRACDADEAATATATGQPLFGGGPPSGDNDMEHPFGTTPDGVCDSGDALPQPRNDQPHCLQSDESLLRVAAQPSPPSPVAGPPPTPRVEPAGRLWTAGGLMRRRASTDAKDADSEGSGDFARRPNLSKMMQSHRGQPDSWIWRQITQHFSKFAEWCESLDPPVPTGVIANIVLSRPFEVFLLVVIVLNAVFTWIVANYEMANLHKEAPEAFGYLETFFLAVYTIELVLKLIVYRQWFFINADWRWNWFDMLLVFSSLTQLIMVNLADSGGSGNLTFVRSLRLFKMATLLRGVRVVEFLKELRTMLFSLLGSLSTLMWGILMLILIFYVFGLVFVQGATAALTEENSMNFEEIRILYKEFGSVEASMLQLYMAATGGVNWVYTYEAVLPMGWIYSGLLLFFTAFSQIALLNILTALFVNKAMDYTKPDTETAAMELRRKDIADYDELSNLAREMAQEGDSISVEDFEREMRSGPLGARLGLLGLTIADPDSFFDLLAPTGRTSTKRISVDEFVEGCMRMKGGASGIDMHIVEKQTRLVLRSLREYQKDTNKTLGQLRTDMQNLLKER
eukprot:CAMPEP_0170214138 /NCGR_PEP_ID=MMETSP0116_2-20130129/6696_1 /TAXON_ID=400756 /ORGANISM="Durinskia baltica, Strain CSIRO CS-38" /LENGTH=614 /DNA_ID=CAMNT_0010464695 /DNA_START=110 /DNA_END=1955 /DNA_ORIENTATION=-